MEKKNLLIYEKSPYLLQHKDNPVHWRPWSEEAFQEARDNQKPLLISIGYSACHWCHVMAHESFEDEEVAKLMNDKFINIKIDREERPDIDNYCMTGLHAMGGHGGWPMTIFMTPSKEIFWGGTYFPKEASRGMPSFKNVLNGISEAYLRDKETIKKNYESVSDAINKINNDDTSGTLSLDILDRVSDQLLKVSDDINGGLMGAPKFPNTHIIGNLWRAYLRTKNLSYKNQVLLTIKKIANGGIYDHLQGGFARYSVDEEWLVPHFEKMLYDNALLVDLFSSVYKTHPDPFIKLRVLETVNWLIEVMQTAEGGFAAAIDADSEGIEGKYYVWDESEIDGILGSQAENFKNIYGVTKQGNFEGKNILFLKAYENDIFDAEIVNCRSKLLIERKKRISPLMDDKILTDWNGLTISALVRASTVFSNKAWLDKAIKAYDFVLNNLFFEDSLYHSWREGEVRGLALADDYAALIEASVALFITTSEQKYLDQSEAIFKILNDNFFDNERGGYFNTSLQSNDLPVRMRISEDGPTPSANGLLFKTLTDLWRITGDNKIEEYIKKLETGFGKIVAKRFSSHCSWIAGFESYHKGTDVFIVGPKNSKITKDMLKKANELQVNDLLVAIIEPGTKLPDYHPAHGKTDVDKTTAFICTGRVCSLPIIDPNDIS